MFCTLTLWKFIWDKGLLNPELLLIATRGFKEARTRTLESDFPNYMNAPMTWKLEGCIFLSLGEDCSLSDVITSFHIENLPCFCSIISSAAKNYFLSFFFFFF